MNRYTGYFIYVSAVRKSSLAFILIRAINTFIIVFVCVEIFDKARMALGHLDKKQKHASALLIILISYSYIHKRFLRKGGVCVCVGEY